MNVSCPRISPLAFSFAFSFAVSLAGCAAQDEVRHSDRIFPGADAEFLWYSTRVVDDLTGAPVVGAEVFLVLESMTPIAGEFWFTHRGISDSEGFVSIPLPNEQKDWHIAVLRHRDHGVSTRSAGQEPLWRVTRAIDVPVRIEDWRGRPVVGARIGFCGGCGHTPDLANATTGADGIAILRGIDPHNHINDVYVQHPGLSLGYDSIEWLPGGPPARIRCEYAPAKSGRVVDTRGQPVAGVHVGALDVHRGPWARTAADGSFTVLGAPADTEVHMVRVGEREIHFDHRGGYPVTLQLPDLTDPEVHEGTAEAPLAPAVEAPPRRQLRVQVDGAPGAVEVDVTFPGRSRVENELPEGVVEVPAVGPFVLYVTERAEHGGRRRFPFDDARDLPASVAVTWSPDVLVAGSAVDASGQPVAIAVRWRSTWSAKGSADEAAHQPFADGRFVVRSPSQGIELFELKPERADLRPRCVWVSVPERDGAGRVDLSPVDLGPVDVGPVVFGREPQLRVLGADGKPPVGVTVGFARPGWQEVGRSRVWPLAADGAWLGPDLRAGDFVVVGGGRDGGSEGEGEHVPFRTELTGDGPWTVSVPAGAIALTVVDAAGAPQKAQLVLGDFETEVDGTDTLFGLRPGPHRLFLSAPGYKTAIVDTVVGAQPRPLRVALQAR